VRPFKAFRFITHLHIQAHRANDCLQLGGLAQK
jgi:hypothetical protein